MVTGGDADTDVAIKSSTPFNKCTIDINGQHIDDLENLDIGCLCIIWFSIVINIQPYHEIFGS